MSPTSPKPRTAEPPIPALQPPPESPMSGVASGGAGTDVTAARFVGVGVGAVTGVGVTAARFVGVGVGAVTGVGVTAARIIGVGVGAATDVGVGVGAGMTVGEGVGVGVAVGVTTGVGVAESASWRLMEASQNGSLRSSRSLVSILRNPCGIHPVRRLLPPRRRDSSRERLPSSGGISPVNWFHERSSSVRLERLPSQSGIFPVNWFHESSNTIRLERLPRSGGIFPVSPNPPKEGLGDSP